MAAITRDKILPLKLNETKLHCLLHEFFTCSLLPHDYSLLTAEIWQATNCRNNCQLGDNLKSLISWANEVIAASTRAGLYINIPNFVILCLASTQTDLIYFNMMAATISYF